MSDYDFYRNQGYGNFAGGSNFSAAPIGGEATRGAFGKSWDFTKKYGSKLGFQTGEDGATQLWGMGGDAWSGIGTGLKTGAELANAWSGIQQVNLAKKQFDFTKNLANRNLENQTKLVNNRIEDRQRASNAMTGISNISPEEARAKYGVKEGGV